MYFCIPLFNILYHTYILIIFSHENPTCIDNSCHLLHHAGFCRQSRLKVYLLSHIQRLRSRTDCQQFRHPLEAVVTEAEAVRVTVYPSGLNTRPIRDHRHDPRRKRHMDRILPHPTLWKILHLHHKAGRQNGSKRHRAYGPRPSASTESAPPSSTSRPPTPKDGLPTVALP